MDFKQEHYRNWKYYKSCYFKKFHSPKFLKHSIIFCDSAFEYFHETNINQLFWGVTQKYELRVSFK